MHESTPDINPENIDRDPAVRGIKAIDFMSEAKKFVNDQDFSDCIDMAMVLIVNPETATVRTSALIVRLEAYALMFRVGFASHMGITSIKDNAKKNIYKELYQGLDNLSDALKYMVKNWNDFQ